MSCPSMWFEVECIDRMYFNVYVPDLQYAAGLVGYVHRQLRLPIASTAPLARITDAFDAAVHRFARDNGVPWVDFVKRATQGRRDARAPGRVHRRRGGAVRRPGAGEDRAVPHRETPRRQRRFLSVDRQDHRAGQPLLLLLRTTTISARSS